MFKGKLKHKHVMTWNNYVERSLMTKTRQYFQEGQNGTNFIAKTKPLAHNTIRMKYDT